MNKVGIDRYSCFGLREEWLISFLNLGDQWLEENNLGSKQVLALLHWLIDGELLDPKTKKSTTLANYLRKLYPKNNHFVWCIIWNNLYYNSLIVRWYCDHIDWGTEFTKKELIEKIALFYPNLRKRTLSNPINALVNTFDRSPLGKDLKIGLLDKKGRIVKSIKKIGTDNIHPLVVAYSLYKVAEHIGRRDFTLSELYSKEFEGGPYKLFGISRDKLWEILKILQEDKIGILRVDLFGDDNIYLRENISSLDVIEFKLYRDTEEEVVTYPTLPLEEIEVEKERLRDEYSTVDRILSEEQKESLKNFLGSEVKREVELIVMDASLNKDIIRRKIEKEFKKDYTIHLCLFLGRDEGEITRIKNLLKELSNDDFKNVIFLVSEVVLDNTTFEKFIEYRARSIVADRYNSCREKKTNEEYAKKVIDNWINSVKSGEVHWILQNETGRELMECLSKKINELSRKIFTYGLDNIGEVQKDKNIWRYKKSGESIEIFLFANTVEDVEKNTVDHPYRYLRGILRDSNGEYIVDDDLRIKENVPEDHPLKKIYLEVKRVLEGEKNRGTFNLGDALRFLTKPPYGLYSNIVHMGTMGFIMREYIGKLLTTRTGTPIERELMRYKILDLFEYWEEGKNRENLEVHFRTEEEKLTENLSNLFNLEGVKSLNDVRWKIRDEKIVPSRGNSSIKNNINLNIPSSKSERKMESIEKQIEEIIYLLIIINLLFSLKK